MLCLLKTVCCILYSINGDPFVNLDRNIVEKEKHGTGYGTVCEATIECKQVIVRGQHSPHPCHTTNIMFTDVIFPT